MQSNEINEILPTSKALHISLDDNPNLAVYKKMEKIIERMQKVKNQRLQGCKGGKAVKAARLQRL